MKQLSLVFTLLVCVGTTRVLAKGIDLMPESAFPTNDEELAELRETAFSDFCLSTRDYVLKDLRNEPTNLIDLLVGYGQGMTPKSRILLERASMKLFNQVEDPDAPIEGLFANCVYDSYIEDGMQKIKQIQSHADRYMVALTYIWLTYSKFSKHELESKVRQAKSQEEMDRVYKSSGNHLSNLSEYIANIRNHFVKAQDEPKSNDSSLVETKLRGAVKNGCSKFSDYKRFISKKFDETKEDIVSKDSSMTNVNLDNIGCLTSKRILNAVAVCDFIEMATQPIFNMLKSEAQ